MGSNANGRKYTDEQIRFVLAQWPTTDRRELATLYRVKFNKEEQDFTEKHAKYIKDAYAKHPTYVAEFGHLQSNKQRENARLREEKKRLVAASAGKENSVPTDTLPVLAGAAGTINAVGLGPILSPSSPTLRMANPPTIGSQIPAPPSPSPYPLLSPTNPLSRIVEALTAADTPASAIPNQLTPRISSSPIPAPTPGFKRGLNIEAKSPCTPSKDTTAITSQQFVPSGPPLSSNHNVLPGPQQMGAQTPTQTSAGHAKAKLLLPKAPSHIDLPTQDFGEHGVWYNDCHDGCRIQGRHRHNRDGSILHEDINQPVLQVQATKPALDSPDSGNMDLSRLPGEEAGPDTGRPPVTSTQTANRLDNRPGNSAPTITQPDNTNPPAGIFDNNTTPGQSRDERPAERLPPEPQQCQIQTIDTQKDLFTQPEESFWEPQPQTEPSPNFPAQDTLGVTMTQQQTEVAPALASCAVGVTPTNSPSKEARRPNELENPPATNTAYDDYPRLPDIIDGEHFQHHVWDRFIELPWESEYMWKGDPNWSGDIAIADAPPPLSLSAPAVSRSGEGTQGDNSRSEMAIIAPVVATAPVVTTASTPESLEMPTPDSSADEPPKKKVKLS